MKKLNLIKRLLSYSHEKQKMGGMRRYAVMLMMLLTLGVGQMWAADSPLTEGSILYCNVTNTTWTGANSSIKFNINKNGTWDKWKGTNISGTNIWYIKVPANVTQAQALRCYNGWTESDNYSVLQTVSSRSNNSQNCFTVKGTNWKDAESSWDTYSPDTKTIHVLMPSDWTTPKLYTWFNNGDNDFLTNGDWPGTNGSGSYGQSITNTSGRWYDVTISAISPNFILTKDNSTKTSDLTYDDVENGEYYIATVNNELASVDVKDISVYIYVGDCTDLQKDNLVLTGTPYVGSIDLPGVNVTSSGFTTEGNWKKYTFSNVTKVHNLQVAGYAGAIPLANIEDATDNFYYRMFNGTVLADKCIPLSNPTWGTTPASGNKGEGMTASVSGAPDGATITWNSTNSSAATVTSGGVISYVAAGSTTITARVQKAASGDNCTLDYMLSQAITVYDPAVTNVTVSPSGESKYGGSDVTWTLTATSQYLAHPVVIFYVSDGTTTYEVTGAPYGSDGESATGTIGAGSDYQTVHKAVFKHKDNNSKDYTVIARLYEGLLIDNFEGGALTKNWCTAGGGSYAKVANPTNGSEHAMKFTRNGEWWSSAHTSVTADVTPATSWNYTAYGYIHMLTYAEQAESSLKMKHNDGTSDANLPTTSSLDASTWTRLAFAKASESINFIFPLNIGVSGNSIYVGDVILSNKAVLNEDNQSAASAASTAFSVSNTYVVTYTEDASDPDRWTYSANDASVVYGTTGHFTVTPAAGYSISVTASDESGSVTLYQDGNLYSFTQGASPVTITVTPTELTNTITVVNGTPTSVTAKVSSTTATVTANAAPTGKKFLTWYLGSGIELVDCEATDRTITFNAAQSTTITAAYTDRDKVTVHFAKPYGWSTVTAVFSNSGSSPSSKQTAVSTTSYEGATYYTFSYYTDNTGEVGGDQSAQAAWNQVVFSDDGSNAHTALTITNGNYYAKGGAAAGRATPYAEWYLRGNLNGDPNWDSGDYYKYPFNVEGSTLEYAFGATTGSAQYFRLYRTSTGQWFRTTDSSPDAAITIGTTYTLAGNGSNADYISTPAGKMGVYLFTLTNLNSATPSLTITHPEDTKYSASVSAGAHGTIDASTSSITQLGRYMPTTITATANAGYRFKEWVTTGGAKVKDPTNRITTATATADGTIEATFTNEGIVYLDVSAIDSWNLRTPTVYFYSGSYWDNSKGSGSKNILYGGERMTRIGTSNIWYYDYSGTSMGIDGTKNYIAFTDHEQDSYANFSSCSAIYRGDFYPAMNTFVPQSTITAQLNNKTVAYYNNGYWMKYNEEESGYNLRIYDGQGNHLQETIPFTTSSVGSRDTYTATLHVDGAASAKFELVGHDQGWKNGIYYDGTFYGNTGTINWTISDWNWEYTKDKGKAYINLNSNGDYVFTLKCGTDGKLYVKVAYPISTGDFRIKYNGLITTEDASKGNMYSDAIPHLTEDGTRTDIVSFFVTNQEGKTAELSLEECTAVNSSTGVITWGASAKGFTGDAISSLTSGVYMFEIVQTRSGGTTSFTYTNLGKYDGKYYVRTDCANGGWVAYKQNEDNLMRETNYASAGYNRYFCRYVPSGSVKFCVANEYNSQLSKQISSDAINTAGDGSITVSANTRFEYDNTTNKVSRSYIGSSADATFLYILDADPVNIYKANGDALTDNKGKFNDDENWIYSLEVQATPGATYQLKAEINGHTQFFDGTASAKTLLGGSGDKQKMRLVYDFKNNHLIKAWLPNGVVSGTYEINADVMLLREGQAAATQLQFGDGAKLLEVHNVYGVLGFKKTDMTNGSLSSYERSLYWVSFPFDVKLKDIFGFGKYGEDFIVRRYNGAKRAEKGWFLGDGTNTFWETMSPDSVKEVDNTMKAYEGYMVALDKGLFIGSDSRWYADEKAIDELYLYFPSASATIGELSKTDKVITLDSMKCTINRTFTQDSELAEDKRRNHKNTDSNWRVIGVGSLHSTQITATELDGTTPTSIDYYAWDASLNKLTSTTCKQAGEVGETTFLSGHAYMVQWYGKIKWHSASVPAVPASVAARRTPAERKNYEVELDLNQNSIMYDRTYVVLQEDASADYVLNEDLYKATNSNYPNIYAFAGAYDCGVSRMPIENTTVPVGVIIRKNGYYTFTMPSNFDGTVTLIDTYTQTRTNLGLEDYEVYLNKGTMDDRFLLEININNAPTAIDGVEGGSLKDGKAHKFIQDGQMYILQDGKIYDARGNRVQ